MTISGSVWTLFVVGPNVGTWGFWRGGQFTDYRDIKPTRRAPSVLMVDETELVTPEEREAARELLSRVMGRPYPLLDEADQ
jgi:hypothetical protein